MHTNFSAPSEVGNFSVLALALARVFQALLDDTLCHCFSNVGHPGYHLTVMTARFHGPYVPTELKV